MVKKTGSRAAVWFDLDGTLIDSLADLGEAVNRMLVELGFPTHPAERFKAFIGDGAQKLVERALPTAKAGEVELLEQAVAAYQRHYEACWHERTVIYPGMLELIQELRQKGVKVGVISNKPHRFTVLCVAHFFPGLGFNVVFGQRANTPKKPDPAAAIEAAAICGVDLVDCVYVGDSGIDMQFAKAAGAVGIGVEWGFRDEAELRAGGSDHLVKDAGDLRRVLMELGVV